MFPEKAINKPQNHEEAEHTDKALINHTTNRKPNQINIMILCIRGDTLLEVLSSSSRRPVSVEFPTRIGVISDLIGSRFLAEVDLRCPGSTGILIQVQLSFFFYFNVSFL